jgi:lipopolysaccharide export system permease protein
MSRRYSRITVYIAREFLFSFVVAFLFFFFIFFINQMLLLAEEILTKHVPPLDVARLVLYSLPSIVALAFPFGTLVGALMSVGRFSSDNEIIAFRASGIPYRRLFLPLIVLGLAFSMISFVMNDYFLPLGTINFGRLYRELIFSNPELELEPFTVKNYQDATIVTGEVSGREIGDLIILDTTDQGERRVITARAASLTEPGGDAGVLSLLMDDVFNLTVKPDNTGDYAYDTAEGMEYNILLQDITFNIRNPGPREMSSYDVWQVIQERQQNLAVRIAEQDQVNARLMQSLASDYFNGVAAVYSGSTNAPRLTRDLNSTIQQISTEVTRGISDRTLQNYQMEFHKKFSIPFACITFVFFAFPVGLMTRRAGRAVGFGIGLLISTLYWGLLIAGQTMGINNPYVSPAAAMWLPNAAIVLLAASAFLVRSRR